MNGIFDSITWWETATIGATVVSAFVQIVSWIFSLVVAFFTRELPKNHRRKNILDKTALIFAGIAAVAALAGSFCSIRYAELADRDNLEVHNKLNEAQKELTQTEGKLTAVTEQLSGAEQELAISKAASERASDLALLITRMNADDALAFDLLRTFKGTPAQEASVKMALEATVQAHRLPYQPRLGHGPFWHVLTDQEVENIVLLDNGVTTYERLGALESLMLKPWQKKMFQMFPRLISLATLDPSLDVRTAATQVLSNWSSNRFQALDKNGVLAWWEANEKTLRKNNAAP